ncbi:hypothetical protein F751_6939 [Auxenochlorella protothecoides]|uniref:Coiled-coil domain-containing protein 86 n=1 Tax=Auxenochlorella protothecoides TaxID=3075 RepID=A0A087SR18_AUXPR|nr:hypothetical protein F751_6939 [Auxenochlorella protothecoides]KFM28172.1 hypothetical protein F751_6939 [Auxenochlorella protothecoides]RMZ54650.1 hypothetical protein APUTEX25_003028 [Auxenochlorella protothecoides]|eukprot:RMZ54650.1 hypothetical protein APUTEX25_003028 [Auxenochlorella protothecoides]
MAAEVPVPPQYIPQPVTDFRGFPDGPRGFKVGVTKKGVLGQKRRLEEYEEQVEKEQEEQAMAGEVQPFGPRKKVKHNTHGLAKVSGRSWKQAGERAGTLRNPKLSTSWDEKMRIKAEKASFLEQKRESQAAWKAKKGMLKSQREEVLRKKEENRKKSEVTVRVSSATAKKMQKSKKARKALRTGE